MMKRHKKLYKKQGVGVELYCGNEAIASSPHRGTNFSIDRCPECGMAIVTSGHSPCTDGVAEEAIGAAL